MAYPSLLSERLGDARKVATCKLEIWPYCTARPMRDLCSCLERWCVKLPDNVETWHNDVDFTLIHNFKTQGWLQSKQLIGNIYNIFLIIGSPRFHVSLHLWSYLRCLLLSLVEFGYWPAREAVSSSLLHYVSSPALAVSCPQLSITSSSSFEGTTSHYQVEFRLASHSCWSLEV